jgi:Flp pilus assembly protein TadB
MGQSEPFDQDSFKRAKATGLPQEGAMTITKNLGMLVLAIYLICVGLVGLAGLSLGIITAILAIVAGVLILIGR